MARIVFIGPCTAKKKELRDPNVAGAVDAVLTFDDDFKAQREQRLQVGTRLAVFTLFSLCRIILG